MNNLLKHLRLATGLLGLAAIALPLHAQNNPAVAKGPLGLPLPATGPHADMNTAREKLRDNMPQQIAEFMKLHNDARAEAGVPPLQWDEGIAAYAQEWAEKIAADADSEAGAAAALRVVDSLRFKK